MMKTILVLAVVLAAALGRPSDTYDPAYDSFNADEIVQNERLLKNYAKCFLGQGPCTPEGLQFRKDIPDAIKTDCVKCSPKQRQLIRTMCHGFKSKVPDLWEELVKKEDPKGEYTAAFEKFLNASD